MIWREIMLNVAIERILFGADSENFYCSTVQLKSVSVRSSCRIGVAIHDEEHSAPSTH